MAAVGTIERRAVNNRRIIEANYGSYLAIVVMITSGEKQRTSTIMSTLSRDQ